MTDLINRMVTLAKMEEPDIVLSTVDFSRIAEDAAEDFKATLVKNGKEFEKWTFSQVSRSRRRRNPSLNW